MSPTVTSVGTEFWFVIVLREMRSIIEKDTSLADKLVAVFVDGQNSRRKRQTQGYVAEVSTFTINNIVFYGVLISRL